MSGCVSWSSVTSEHQVLKRSRLALLTAVFLVASAAEAVAQLAPCDPTDVKIATTPIFSQRPANFRLFLQKEGLITESADVVLLGDSILNRWPGDQVQRLFPGATILNLGIEGDTVQNLLWRLSNSRIQDVRPPQTAVVMIGINNLLDGVSACAVAAGTEAVLKNIRMKWPSTEILHLEVLPSGPGFMRRYSDLQNLNKEVSTFVAGMSNARSFVADASLTCGPPAAPNPVGRHLPFWPFLSNCKNFLPDNLHPSPEGYRVLTSILLSAMY
ncbi:Lysophospholipase L1 [Devosia sp. YR412]|uniref:GDSL-type esterase/lipase family protein n=1 Tax=Devosia sp. YR412 TaxID=1881030 RepID=UPI0008B76444|nr:GDSL-type esterase/lipase family protein [Devosia sp. YR412]SEQ53711.1 Lysophospholipase L1 [Devosia sp. YR412]